MAAGLTGTNQEPISGNLASAALPEWNRADARKLRKFGCEATFRETKFPVKSRKIPCSQGISPGASDIRCYLLHFGNGIEGYQRVDPDLFSLGARAHTRAGPRQAAAAQCDSGGCLKRYARYRPL